VKRVPLTVSAPAASLLYAEGVQSVGVDRMIARAGLACANDRLRPQPSI
jgi:hypothetical protein